MKVARAPRPAASDTQFPHYDETAGRLLIAIQALFGAEGDEIVGSMARAAQEVLGHKRARYRLSAYARAFMIGFLSHDGWGLCRYIIPALESIPPGHVACYRYETVEPCIADGSTTPRAEFFIPVAIADAFHSPDEAFERWTGIDAGSLAKASSFSVAKLYGLDGARVC